MAQAGPPVSDDGLWFWDGSKWKSLLSADGQRVWTGTAWMARPPQPENSAPPQPPSAPPPGVGPPPPPPPPPAPVLPPPPTAYSAPGQLPSPPGYASPAAAPVVGPPPVAPPPPAPEAPPEEPRPDWLPADAPWPPPTFTASPVPLTTDAPMAAPAPGAVPWANVYSNVIAASAGTRYSYAGFWIRVVANIIDSLIVSIPIAIIAYALLAPALTSGQDLTTVDPTNLNILRLVSTAASVGYFVYFWTTGATPGMRLFGIRVADASTGQTIGFGKAFIRYLGYLLSSACCGIGFLWAAFDGRKQGWHDKIAGTVVLFR